MFQNNQSLHEIHPLLLLVSPVSFWNIFEPIPLNPFENYPILPVIGVGYCMFTNINCHFTNLNLRKFHPPLLIQSIEMSITFEKRKVERVDTMTISIK